MMPADMDQDEIELLTVFEQGQLKSVATKSELEKLKPLPGQRQRKILALIFDFLPLTSLPFRSKHWKKAFLTRR